MKPFVIMADITCDLTQDLRERFDVEFIPGHMKTPDGEDIPTELEWTRWTSDEFYAQLRKNPDAFATSPPNVTELQNAFEAHVKKGDAILALAISSGLSGTYGFMLKAKENILEQYPDAKIEVVDSLRYSTLLGLMTIHASMLRDEGKSLEETAAWLVENRNRFHQMGWLDDLSFVAKKGRVSNSAAFFGTLIGIKPLGDIDYNGLTTVLGKAKGEKSAYAAIIKYMEETIEDPQDQIIFVAQTNRLRQAKILKGMIEEKFSPREVILTDVFPACGVNIGPGLMAAYYLGKPASEGLAEEKALMERTLAK